MSVARPTAAFSGPSVESGVTIVDMGLRSSQAQLTGSHSYIAGSTRAFAACSRPVDVSGTDGQVLRTIGDTVGTRSFVDDSISQTNKSEAELVIVDPMSMLLPQHRPTSSRRHVVVG